MSLAISLADLQKQAGAVFDDTAPAEPVHYGNPHGEYAIADTEAGVVDFSSRCQIELTGGDRVKFLQNFCTNDVRTLQPGQGCEAFMTSVQGKVLAHLFIFAGEKSLIVESAPGTEDAIVRHLDKYLIAEDVEIHPRSAAWGEFLVTGPEASERLAGLDVATEGLGALDHRRADLEGIEFWIRRVDWTSQPGFLLSFLRSEAAAIWSRLTAGGIRPVGSGAFHSLRIEACRPWDRVDITDENLAQEVAITNRTISFSKGCYLGQEPIARIDAMGHVNRELRGIRLSSGPAPKPGAAVMSAPDGAEIGTITSAAISYRDDLPVALAYLRRNHLEAGSIVHVASDGGTIPGTVFWTAD